MNINEKELYLYATNSAPLYYAAIQPTLENLAKKVERGVFDREKAIISFMKIVTIAAKSYYKEFCSPDISWYKIFNVPTRRTVAEEMLNNYSEELGLD